MTDPDHITDLVDRAVAGDARAVDELLPALYDELRRLAERRMGGEGAGHTLEATALVHEAYIRLAGQERAEWKGRSHFMAIAAETMRRVLVDHARGRKAAKRGGGARPLSLDTSLIGGDRSETSLLDLERALERLAETRPEKARVVELRFYGGMTNDEVAEMMDVSARTVERHWQFARAWLTRELGGG